MAEETQDLTGLDKDEAYRQLATTIEAVLDGVRDRYTAMATVAALLHHGFRYLWTGFYTVATPTLLRVGPYQGTMGCLEIAFGRGVCGTAAAEKRTVVVDDVHAFPGHIACDARSRSEIVVPVLDRSGALIAVLDIDSDALARFDARDAAGLATVVDWFARADLTPVHPERPVRADAGALPTLLVVDDEQPIVNALRRMLRTRYRVTTLTDSAQALDALTTGPLFDLVLTDLSMPGLNGMQLYERAMAARAELGPRFVFLTGGDYGHGLQAFLARFPDRCIDKPFDQASMQSVLEAAYARVGRAIASSDETA